MNIKQCIDCGKLFQSFGSYVCPDCIDEMDRGFIKVRDYIYANPKAGIMDITEKTGVKERWILTYLKEERLTLGTVSGYLVCEQCGKPIAKGKICDDCKDRLQKELQRVIPERSPEKKMEPSLGFSSRRDGRMHVIKKKI